MNKDKFLLITVIIIAAVVSRFIPHPPNFSPISAIALFGGAYYTDKKLSFIIPLLAMFLSDLFIGLHSLIPFIYASFAVIVFIGFQLRQKKSPVKIGLAAVTGSVVFFIVTNFAVWLIGSFYPKTVDGLVACYVAAIPFFQNTLMGDLIYATLLFGSFELIKNYSPILQEVKVEK